MKKILFTALMAGAALLVLPFGTQAQDVGGDPAPAAKAEVKLDDKQMAVKKQHEAFGELEAAYNEFYEEINKRWQALPQDESSEAARKALQDEFQTFMKGHEVKVQAATALLAAAMDKVPYESWNKEASKELVSIGLSAQIETYKKSDLTKASTAFTNLIALDKNHESIAEYGLSLSQAAAISGDYDSAKSFLKTSEAALPKNLNRNDPRAGNAVEIKAQLALIGEAAPEIDSKEWMGADAKKLSDLKGKVVVLDVWGSWCPPCIRAIPGLDQMAKDMKDKGLVIVGATSFTANGYMPESMAALKGQGKVARENGMTQESWREHLTRFRTNTGVSYPFVIVPQSIASDYQVNAFPTMMVIDKEGKVAARIVGADEEGLKHAIEGILGRKEKTDKKTADSGAAPTKG